MNSITISSEEIRFLAYVLPLVHGTGILLAIDAVWQARTSQGAIAWASCLVFFPYGSIPFYMVFGRSRFQGYVRARRSQDINMQTLSRELSAKAQELKILPDDKSDLPGVRVLQKLARMPFTTGNSAKLLIDGEQTFKAIFTAIEEAKHYVLVQFYIARDDELGQRLAELLKCKVSQGVNCYYLFDEVGSHFTRNSYWSDLVQAGVKAAPFNTQRGGLRNRFQINFRNHRKVVVVDGTEAFVGGHNMGMDYLGKGPLGRWRDTQVAVTGPLVAAVQMTFVEDWFWATEEVPALSWELTSKFSGNLAGLCLSTGPSDEFETCALMFSQIIQSAQKRLWISTPYFVPDSLVLSQLKLAALRGVDVRILLPDKPDTILPFLASFAFIELTEGTGVHFYRYKAGFPHQKVVLIDDEGALIGTANLDNRSFRLNFEISLLLAGASIAKETAQMLEKDFSQSERVPVGALQKRSFLFRLAVRVARLFAPIL